MWGSDFHTRRHLARLAEYSSLNRYCPPTSATRSCAATPRASHFTQDGADTAGERGLPAFRDSSERRGLGGPSSPQRQSRSSSRHSSRTTSSPSHAVAPPARPVVADPARRSSSRLRPMRILPCSPADGGGSFVGAELKLVAALSAGYDRVDSSRLVGEVPVATNGAPTHRGSSTLRAHLACQAPLGFTQVGGGPVARGASPTRALRAGGGRSHRASATSQEGVRRATASTFSCGTTHRAPGSHQEDALKVITPLTSCCDLPRRLHVPLRHHS